jgi:predicted nuclease of predicted toxin-antitoxin system
MKYLADESLEYTVVTFLRENKIDILAVREFMRGATDSEIIEHAFKNELIIITSDKDFGELTFRLKRPNCGIILTRFPDTNNTDKAKLLLSALKKLNQEAKNKFIVIDKLKIRIRKIFL